jgi:hypothetical protein
MKRIQVLWGTVRRTVLHWIHRDRLITQPAEELPESLQSRRLYLLGADAPWSAAFVCPCGCREVIHVSLLQDDSPRWTISFDRDGYPSLSPSVWRTKGCRSHFFLRSGAIVWCQNRTHSA